MKVRAVILAAVLGICGLTTAPAAEAAGRTVKIGDANATEGKVLLFPVTLSNTAPYRVSVDFTTVEGTANDNDDYVGRGGRLTFRPGVKKRVLAIATNTDAADEVDETIAVVLSGPRKTAIGRSRATGTITDDDQPPTVSVSDANAVESDANLSFDVVLSAPSGRAVAVDVATEDGTAVAGDDYIPTNRTITFAPGESRRSLDVPLANDGEIESVEDLALVIISASNASLGSVRATGTINDDDEAVPALTIDDVTGSEGGSGETFAFRFPVTLTAPSSDAVTVEHATTFGSAGSDDVMPASGRLTYLPGDTVEYVSVIVRGDAIDEPDEDFTVTLSAPMNATLLDESGTGTIVDDDPAPSVTVADASAAEDAGSLSFVVSLSAPSGRVVTVDYDTALGTAEASDATANGGTVTFASGETSHTVDVTIHDDAVDEDDETVSLDLSQPSNVSIGDGHGVGTIIDDDASPSVSVSDGYAREGSPVTVDVTLSAASERTASVVLSCQDDTATNGTDYHCTTRTLTFAPGVTSIEVTFETVADRVNDQPEFFGVSLSDPSNTTIARGDGIAKID